jgi:hypothetical protein
VLEALMERGESEERFLVERRLKDGKGKEN